MIEKRVQEELIRIVGADHFDASPEERACYSYDGSGQGPLPDAVIFPGDVNQISRILQLANQYRFPVVPRGAGSGMTGGALPVAGGLILVMTRLNKILEIDKRNMIAIVEPGVITGDLQQELARHGLYYPPDPASLKFCTLGGNAAECAGGPSAVKYGVTRDYVIGLEVVLPSGEIMHTGVRTEKGVVGYDLTRLFLGSEGTLGVFTRLILRLLPLPEKKETLLLHFAGMREAAELVAAILAAGIAPCTLEYMDHNAIAVIAHYLKEDLPAATGALLLLEIDGQAAFVGEQISALLAFLAQHEVRYQLAAGAEERRALWQARRSISPALFSLKPHKISEDVVVPRASIPQLVDFLDKLGRELQLTILSFGHAGDGNIHVNIMLDRNQPTELAAARRAKEALFAHVLQAGGTLSGEHGIGTTKSAFLPLEIDPVALRTMRQIKSLFDPLHILNPGKIFQDPGDTP